MLRRLRQFFAPSVTVTYSSNVPPQARAEFDLAFQQLNTALKSLARAIEQIDGAK